MGGVLDGLEVEVGVAPIAFWTFWMGVLFREVKFMRRILAIILSVTIVLGIIGGVLFVFQSGGVPFVSSPRFTTGSYQAVFLTNGQVYFGKVSDFSNRYVKLNDIYYLILRRELQPQEPPVEGEQQPQFTLIKLGNELHGPVDEMVINRDQVLFIEELKSDGRVVQAIQDFRAGNIPTP